VGEHYSGLQTRRREQNTDAFKRRMKHRNTIFELQQHQDKTKARNFPKWRRRLSNTQNLQVIIRTL